jgi:hypothetical protein
MPYIFLLRCGIIALNILLYFPIFQVNASESDKPKLLLKQLIVQSRENLKTDPRLYFSVSIKFEPKEVRKHYYGDERGFLREICILFQNGNEEDRFDVLNLLFHLDIKDADVSRCLRNEFELIGNRFLQLRMIHAIAKDESKENIDFLLAIFKQDKFPPVFRVQIAYLLSDTEFLKNLNDKIIVKKIFDVFSKYLSDEREIMEDMVYQCRVGDVIAFRLGNFVSFAKDILPIIQNKYSMIGSAVDSNSTFNKLRLSCAIVQIDPGQVNMLDYIFTTALNDQSEFIRFEAIFLLGRIDPSLSEKTISCLCEVIQKETVIANRVQAVESLKKILKPHER